MAALQSLRSSWFTFCCDPSLKNQFGLQLKDPPASFFGLARPSGRPNYNLKPVAEHSDSSSVPVIGKPTFRELAWGYIFEMPADPNKLWKRLAIDMTI